MTAKTITYDAVSVWLADKYATEWAEVLASGRNVAIQRTVASEILREFIGDGETIAPMRVVSPTGAMYGQTGWKLSADDRLQPEQSRYLCRKAAYELRSRYARLIALQILVRLAHSGVVDLGHPQLAKLIEVMLSVYYHSELGTPVQTCCDQFLWEFYRVIPPGASMWRETFPKSERGVYGAIVRTWRAEVGDVCVRLSSDLLSREVKIVGMCGAGERLYISAPTNDAALKAARDISDALPSYRIPPPYGTSPARRAAAPRLTLGRSARDYYFGVVDDRPVWVKECVDHRRVYERQLATHLPAIEALPPNEKSNALLALFDVSQARVAAHARCVDVATLLYSQHYASPETACAMIAATDALHEAEKRIVACCNTLCVATKRMSAEDAALRETVRHKAIEHNRKLNIRAAKALLKE